MAQLIELLTGDLKVASSRLIHQSLFRAGTINRNIG